MKLLKKPQICHHFFKHEQKILSSSIFTSKAIHFSQSRQFPTATMSDPSSTTAVNTNPLLFINHSPVKNVLWEARSSIFWKNSSISSSFVTSTQSIDNHLIVKTPARSRTSVLYRFSSEYGLRERYRNAMNEIRIEKLLEDLDALGGTISYKHCSSDDGTARSLTLVTASVDNMILKKPICIHNDLTIEGAVTWVGCSSLEVQLDVKQSTKEPTNSTGSVYLTANFTFVAKDKTGKSAKINQILPETEKEKLLFREAEERNKMRKKKKEKKRDNLGELKVNKLNELLLKNRDDDNYNNNILIKETCLQNSLVCQPEQNNIHGQIFGGYLMRKAYELAYATAYSFVGTPPCFVEVDHVDFLKPIIPEINEITNDTRNTKFTWFGNLPTSTGGSNGFYSGERFTEHSSSHSLLQISDVLGVFSYHLKPSIYTTKQGVGEKMVVINGVPYFLQWCALNISWSSMVASILAAWK